MSDIELDPMAGCLRRVKRETFEPLILAIDPGTTKSGWVTMLDGKVMDSGVLDNYELLKRIQSPVYDYFRDLLAIEMIQSYGMSVGKEVFETCVWIGRFLQAWPRPDDVALVYRKEVKLHLCGTTKAKDANIRQAIIDLYPATGGGKVPQIGIKSNPGPLYGVSSHAWPAIGVALTFEANRKKS